MALGIDVMEPEHEEWLEGVVADVLSALRRQKGLGHSAVEEIMREVRRAVDAAYEDGMEDGWSEWNG